MCAQKHERYHPTPPHPQSSGVYMWPRVTITCVYMWPSLECADDRTCVYMWPWVSLVCTCDRHLRAQVTVRLEKGLCVYMWPGFACADDPLTLQIFVSLARIMSIGQVANCGGPSIEAHYLPEIFRCWLNVDVLFFCISSFWLTNVNH